ncbi:STAS-like domain-containing protein [Desulfoscipio geothermicus]|uniref:DUF4325 domain-containing protein n=1 Tax=Desulfoscipio geothermicus DSM 3669 TaxID=1121426 RepID=A0A1I6E413_9FIRM|nr:STAS-like domain-containing protein [Desulfoscipio geothermicus]SFR12499.1 protein of unknown function [Desulfoscipio geothermicus DSM 3669]
MIFKFGEIGMSLGTRVLGVEAREKLHNILINTNDIIILDFEGVTVLSNSFADECIAKLAKQVGFNKFKSRTTFRNFNPFIAKVIKNALNNRLAMN